MMVAAGQNWVIGAAEQADLLCLQRSGLFDGAWFADRNPDLAASPSALVHWHRYGWREGRWPNPYFDPAYYRTRAADCSDDPLLHYIRGGEAAGCRPVLHFDPAWYRRQHAIPEGELCLAHFLRHRHTGRVSPLAEFDAAFYLREYRDVAAAGMDPMEHFLIRGAAEGRLPRAGFDARRAAAMPHPNKLLGQLLWRERAGLDGQHANIADEVRRNTRPHPAMEDVRPLPPGLPRRAKLLAYYLPQYHPVPENDAWWGPGFTEWTNLGRALPRFAGHLQPRIPRDLGHYRLDCGDTLRRQIALAKGAGLHGFVFYYYAFNGRRLLDAPLEALLADPALDMPFCLMWANENWTRRWDGSEQDVLLSQDYRLRDEPALVADFVRHFADARYIRLGGRPVLMVYRARLIPSTAATVERWRRLFRAAGHDPLFIMAQSFDDRDPRPFGMDAAVEFPPHKLTQAVPMVNADLQVLDPAFDAEVYGYAAIARASVAEPPPAFPLIRTAAPGWDNDPRRQGRGTVLHGATPALFQAWLEDLVSFAQAHPVEGESVVCINAWNEWAEGAVLEPDTHWGAAFLNAAARAVTGLPAPGERTRILLVGHDALRHGAQTLLLQIGQALRRVHGVDIGFLLLGGGPMQAAYAALAPTTVVPDPARLDDAVRSARAAGGVAAIVNSAASAAAVPVLARHGLRTVLLVHEMPRLLREKGLLDALPAALAAADAVAFPAALVRDQCLDLAQARPAAAVILPQGIDLPDANGGAIRQELRVPPGGGLALGMGYADLRKGFDLFLQAWRAARAAGSSLVFAWAGGADPALHGYLAGEIAAAEATGTFRYLGQRADAAALLAAADVLLLTSREDPLPSVALEAMASGTPVAAFEDTGGAPELIERFAGGASVPLGDTAALAALAARLAAWPQATRAALAARCRPAFRFSAYSTALLALARPASPGVSVVIPSFNYARYMPARLASVFAQTHPVTEVIVLDDASSDGSADAARQAAAAWQRDITVHEADRPSGVFAQWRRAAEVAAAEWLWIAEADDAADPALLAALAEAVTRAPGAVFAFCDSRAIDADGAELWPDYKRYYGPGVLAADAIFDAADFLRTHLAERNLVLNASAVLWRRSALLAALKRCGAELSQLRLAGDWRLYAEILAEPGAQVAYVARPLNHHRRHDASVTARTPRPQQAAEAAIVHAAIARLTGADAALRKRQDRYRRALVRGRA